MSTGFPQGFLKVETNTEQNWTGKVLEGWFRQHERQLGFGLGVGAVPSPHLTPEVKLMRP